MKNLISALVFLYPKAWRTRYGAEFRALLEETPPGWRMLFNVLGSAIKMQFSIWSPWKTVAACTIAGVIASAGYALSLPRHYVSTAVLKADDDRLDSALVTIEGRASLIQIIFDQNLYPRLRAEEAIGDVIEQMKIHDISILRIGPSGYSISYTAPDPNVARRVTARLTELMLDAAGGELLDQASVPAKPVSLQWAAALSIGLLAGLLLGATVALITGLKVWKLTIELGFACGAVSTVIAFLVPQMFTSTAVVRVQRVDAAAMSEMIRNVTSDEGAKQVIHMFSLDHERDFLDGWPSGPKKIAHPIEQFRDRLRIAPIANGRAFTVTFRDPNRWWAQKVAQKIGLSLINEANQTDGRVRLELLDPASFPGNPISPNRRTIIAAGALIGLLLATLLGLKRRLTVTAHLQTPSSGV